MPELIAKPALEVAPVTLAGVTLAVTDPGPITTIAPFPGQEKAVAKALKTMGLSFPEPNGSVGSGSARLVWTGREQAALIGVPPVDGLLGVAAVTDQSDGWIALSLTGVGADQVLMRLVALDLRAQIVPPGTAVRSALNHMPLILIREETGFLILTFRSMARTAWHEVESALRGFAARSRLPG